jgi:energy-converting hydrogenase Eha subunit H
LTVEQQQKHNTTETTSNARRTEKAIPAMDKDKPLPQTSQGRQSEEAFEMDEHTLSGLGIDNNGDRKKAAIAMAVLGCAAAMGAVGWMDAFAMAFLLYVIGALVQKTCADCKMARVLSGACLAALLTAALALLPWIFGAAVVMASACVALQD